MAASSSGKSKVVPCSGWDGSVKLWELASGRCLQTLEGHTERVQALAWSADGGTLASGSFDHTIRLWEGQEGRSRGVLQGHRAEVYSLAFTPDSHHLLSSSEDGTLQLWEVASACGSCRATPPPSSTWTGVRTAPGSP